MNKTCRVCDKEKPVTEFNRNYKMRDGRLNHCRDCTQEYRKLNREKDNETNRKWRIANRSRILESHRRYRNTLDGKITRMYHRAKARAKKYNVEDTLTIDELREIVEFTDVCIYTGEDITFDNMSIEHVIGMGHGGANAKGNVIIVSKSANTSKGNRTVAEHHARSEAFDDQLLFTLTSFVEITSGMSRREVEESFGIRR